jgi:chromosome segregation ATPase
MTRDRLEDAFLRLRAAADADEYVPMEDVIEVVLDRLAHAEDVQNGDDAASRVAERVMREVRKDFEAVLEAREVEHRRQMANKEKRHAEEKQHLRDQLKDAEEACEAHEAVEAKLRKERFEEIAKADKLVVDLNEVTNALSAAHTREAIARAAIADRDRRLDQIAAAAALVQTTVQQYFDQHGPSCDEHSDEPDHTCPTCCIDIDASGAISGLKFWSKP